MNHVQVVGFPGDVKGHKVGVYDFYRGDTCDEKVVFEYQEVSWCGTFDQAVGGYVKRVWFKA